MATRRSILGMLAGAPVAASAIGTQAAGQLVGNAAYANKATALGLASAKMPGDWLKERIADIRRDLANIGQDRAARLADIRQNISQVDPDIAAMRSLSDVTKQRMQAERVYERQTASHRSWLSRQLSDLLKESGTPADPI